MPISYGPLVDHGLRLGFSTKKASISIQRPGQFDENDQCGNVASRIFTYAASGQGRENCDDIMKDRFLLTSHISINPNASNPVDVLLASGVAYADLDGLTFNMATFTAKGFTPKGAQLQKGDIGSGAPEYTLTFSFKESKDVCDAVQGHIRSVSVTGYEKDEDCNIIQVGSSSISWLYLAFGGPAIATTITTLKYNSMVTEYLAESSIYTIYEGMAGTTISI